MRFPNHIFALLEELGFTREQISAMTWDYMDQVLSSYYGDSERLPNGEWGN